MLVNLIPNNAICRCFTELFPSFSQFEVEQDKQVKFWEMYIQWYPTNQITGSFYFQFFIVIKEGEPEITQVEKVPSERLSLDKTLNSNCHNNAEAQKQIWTEKQKARLT